MTAHRSVRITRTELGTYTATNAAGVQIPFGNQEGQFTPVELLLAAIAGCTAIDVDYLTSRRAEPESFEVDIDADKIKDDHGNRLDGITVTFRLGFPEGEDGQRARTALPRAVERSHDFLCTVGRTVEVGAVIRNVIK